MFINVTGSAGIEIIKVLTPIITSLIWPLTALIIFFAIREPISIFIRNMKNGSARIPGGIEFKLSAQAETVTQEVETKQVKEIVGNDLATLEDIKKLKDEKDQLLITNFFERTYRLIFNSQLNVIFAASQRISIPRDEIFDMYNTTQWADSYPFEQYMIFLLNSNLLVFNLETNSYSITPIGRLFVQYLNNNNIPFNKLPLDWKATP